MILKRQEKDNKIKAMYSSSTILASTFDTLTNDLTIIFKNGGHYKYASVSNTDYTRFELADSQGTVLNSHIKKYTFEKLQPVDTTIIIKEIEEMKALDDKATAEKVTKVVLENMVKVFHGYITTGKIELGNLSKLETSIADFNKVSKPVTPTSQVLA